MYNQPPGTNQEQATPEVRVRLTYDEALAAGLALAGLTLEQVDALPTIRNVAPPEATPPVSTPAFAGKLATDVAVASEAA
jgi:hypothetical protein